MEKENLVGALLLNLMWWMERATNWLASHFPLVFWVRGPWVSKPPPTVLRLCDACHAPLDAQPFLERLVQK